MLQTLQCLYSFEMRYKHESNEKEGQDCTV